MSDSRAYFWPTVGADDVLVIAAEDGDGGHFKADRALKLFFLRLNLAVDVFQQS